ncbi:inovirus Gp2 family protein [Pectobacterium aroidearum]|uniref:inovirus Gp2 family protein n=1 Tax=Pectobacterium aroidearum TaxID=1201031 RepID=UPI00331521E8
MNYTYNPFWQQRIIDTFLSSLDAYRRVLMLRVDLRIPNIPAATDAAVISRFIESLKAKIKACQQRKQRKGKRVHITTLRYIWVREYGEINGKKHYHVILLLNRDAWCGAGNFLDTNSLAGMIQQAWCSALHIDVQRFFALVHFPDNPSLWIDRRDNEQLQKGLERAMYLAKYHTKVTDDGDRNFGCSQC